MSADQPALPPATLEPLAEPQAEPVESVALAEHIARDAHSSTGQHEASTGDPYIRHIERVVSITAALTARDPHAISTAWLHDVIEDTSLQADELLSLGVPQLTVSAVVCLTRMVEIETYDQYINRLARLTESSLAFAVIVKLADLLDHFRPGCPPRLLPRYVRAWNTLATPDVTLPLLLNVSAIASRESKLRSALENLQQYTAIERQADDSARRLIGLSYRGTDRWGPCYDPTYEPMELCEEFEKWLKGECTEALA